MISRQPTGNISFSSHLTSAPQVLAKSDGPLTLFLFHGPSITLFNICSSNICCQGLWCIASSENICRMLRDFWLLFVLDCNAIRNLIDRNRKCGFGESRFSHKCSSKYEKWTMKNSCDPLLPCNLIIAFTMWCSHSHWPKFLKAWHRRASLPTWRRWICLKNRKKAFPKLPITCSDHFIPVPCCQIQMKTSDAFWSIYILPVTSRKLQQGKSWWISAMRCKRHCKIEHEEETANFDSNSLFLAPSHKNTKISPEIWNCRKETWDALCLGCCVFEANEIVCFLVSVTVDISNLNAIENLFCENNIFEAQSEHEEVSPTRRRRFCKTFPFCSCFRHKETGSSSGLRHNRQLSWSEPIQGLDGKPAILIGAYSVVNVNVLRLCFRARMRMFHVLYLSSQCIYEIMFSNGVIDWKRRPMMSFVPLMASQMFGEG